jgi:predicted dinucleotide-binding enzyme
MKISFIGGGAVAQAISVLAKSAGHAVILGVRDPATKAIDSMFTMATIEEASTVGDLVVIALPFSAIAEVLPPLADDLAGKIVIDVTNPVNADWSPVSLGDQSSGGEEMARHLPRSSVVKAFSHIFADVMRADRLDRSGQKVTAFVASDDAAARRTVIALAAELGFAPIEAGPLKSARYMEAMAHLNIELALGQRGGTNAAFIYDRVS